MRYFVEIRTLKNPSIMWINGGVGYTEEELVRVKNKIKRDPRIIEYRVMERK